MFLKPTGLRRIARVKVIDRGTIEELVMEVGVPVKESLKKLVSS